jgi:hypothetical protein
MLGEGVIEQAGHRLVFVVPESSIEEAWWKEEDEED